MKKITIVAVVVLAGVFLFSGWSVSEGGDNTAPPAGTLDTTFDSDGIVTTDIGSGNHDDAQAIAIDSGGKIVVAGGRSGDFALARYKSNGTLDTTFGTGGKVTTHIGSYDDDSYAIAIDSAGKIVVAGYSSNGSDRDFALARYKSNGTLDTTFGTGGKVTTPIGSGDDYARAIAIDSAGKIVVAGYSHNGSNGDFALARYKSNGTLDTTFGTGGKVTTPIGSNSDDYAVAMAIDSGGKIVMAGYSNNGADNDFALARYNSNGTLDTNFGTGGKVTMDIGSGDDYARAIAIDSGGKIVVAGYSYNGNYEEKDFALARYNVDGTLDTNFDSDGIVTTDIGSSEDDIAQAIAIDSGGKIVVAGYSTGSNYDFALARYNVDGTLDTGFGTGGKVTTPIGRSDDRAYAIAIDSAGKIVVAGESHNGSTADFALARYWP